MIVFKNDREVALPFDNFMDDNSRALLKLGWGIRVECSRTIMEPPADWHIKKETLSMRFYAANGRLAVAITRNKFGGSTAFSLAEWQRDELGDKYPDQFPQFVGPDYSCGGA